MKIMSLNTWGARAGHQKFLDFLKNYKDDIDIFCLQEIHDNTDKLIKSINLDVSLDKVMFDQLEQLDSLLDKHDMYFRPHLEDCYGLVTFVGKSLKVEKEGEDYVYKHKGWVSEDMMGNHARNIQFLILSDGRKTRTVFNVHGIWNGKGKDDTEDRITQSEKINEIMGAFEGPKILCGDLNLLPETKSIEILESDKINLIKKFNISSTRSSFYEKPLRHADYIFVTDDVEVLNFEVLSDEISDHLPLLLEFN